MAILICEVPAACTKTRSVAENAIAVVTCVNGEIDEERGRRGKNRFSLHSRERLSLRVEGGGIDLAGYSNSPARSPSFANVPSRCPFPLGVSSAILFQTRRAGPRPSSPCLSNEGDCATRENICCSARVSVGQTTIIHTAFASAGN